MIKTFESSRKSDWFAIVIKSSHTPKELIYTYIYSLHTPELQLGRYLEFEVFGSKCSGVCRLHPHILPTCKLSYEFIFLTIMKVIIEDVMIK